MIIQPIRYFESWPFWQGIELFGTLPLTFYGLAYMLGLALALWYMMRLAKTYPSSVTPELVNDYLLYAVLGVVLGGRIGYALFYPSELGNLPFLQIFNPFYGQSFGLSGMSFHGGLIGVVLALFLFWLVRRRKFQFFALTDLIAVAVPMGLYFGRLANFLNRELYGRVAPDWWPIKVRFAEPGLIESRGCSGPDLLCDLTLLRHPSQLYEALLEGTLLFLLLGLLFRLDFVRTRAGFLTGLFLLGYGSARATIEYFRQPDILVQNASEWFTRGQQLSLPMMALGVILIALAWRKSLGERP